MSVQRNIAFIGTGINVARRIKPLIVAMIVCVNRSANLLIHRIGMNLANQLSVKMDYKTIILCESLHWDEAIVSFKWQLMMPAHEGPSKPIYIPVAIRLNTSSTKYTTGRPIKSARLNLDTR